MPKKPKSNNSISSQLYNLYRAGVIAYATYSYYKTKPASQIRRFVATQNKFKKPLKKCTVEEVCKEVKVIKKHLDQMSATHIHKFRNVNRLFSNEGDAQYTSYAIGNTGTIEAALANLRYFDPGTNALVNANPASGTYSRDIHVKKTVHSALVRNNYQVPADVRVYAYIPRGDTDNTPNDLRLAGLADQGNPGAGSLMLYPSDSRLVSKTWRPLKVLSKVLQPGQQMSISHLLKSYEYSFDNSDENTEIYKKDQGGFAWLIRIEGCLGHDSVLNEQNSLASGVDIEYRVIYEFEYDAGKDLYDISVSDTGDTFTNTPLISNRPMSDNQGYSVT